MNDLEKLFLSELKTIYDAEQQLETGLSELEQAATAGELKIAFQEHREETREHISRLERVFQEIGEQPKRKPAKGIEGMIEEARSLARKLAGNPALDAALLAAAQRAEHYEITAYGTLCTWAEELDKDEVLGPLKENLGEEKAADEKLTLLAESGAGLKIESESTGAFRVTAGHQI